MSDNETPVLMPGLGESVVEATLTTWRKQEGDWIHADETLAEISTDKVDSEIPAPCSGTVGQLLVAEGETVDVGTPITVITPADAGPAPEPIAAPASPVAPAERAERLSPMRRTIAARMRQSVDTAAHVTTTFEVDYSTVAAIRHDLAGRISLSYLPFVARAVASALADWPLLNSELRGDEVVVKRDVNLSVAVATAGGLGLQVPVVRDIGHLGLFDIAARIEQLATAARTNTLTREDVRDGTYTITNAGGWGAVLGTPIINQPQVAVLAMEHIGPRPKVVTDDNGDQRIEIRTVGNLCMSYDHRLIDGAYGSQFLRELTDELEQWTIADYQRAAT